VPLAVQNSTFYRFLSTILPTRLDENPTENVGGEGSGNHHINPGNIFERRLVSLQSDGRGAFSPRRSGLIAYSIQN
jgi:hypothetical protein